MSYRNPKQVVDTQSGQYVREMQQSLSNTTNKTIQGLNNIYLENQKQIKEIANEAAEATSKIENAVFQTQSKNSTIEFDALNGQLNEYSDLKKQDPTKLTNKQRNFMRSMENIGTTMKNSLANTTASAIAFKEQTDKGLGEDGGNDEFRNPRQYKTMSIMNGTIPGSKKAIYSKDAMGNVVYSVEVYDAKGIPVGKVINNNIENTMFVSKVPDLTAKKANALEMVKAELTLGNKWADAYKKGEKFGDNKQGAKVNVDVFNKAIEAQAKNIYLEMDDNEIASYWNNKYKKQGVDPWSYDTKDGLTSEQKEDFRVALVKDIKGTLGAVRELNKIQTVGKDAKDDKKDTIIVQNFKEAVLGGAKNIQFSTDRFATLTTDTENVEMENGYYEKNGKLVKDEKAVYVYQPPQPPGASGVVPTAIKVKYWKRIPKDPNDLSKGYAKTPVDPKDPTKGYKYKLEKNTDNILSFLNSSKRNLSIK